MTRCTKYKSGDTPHNITSPEKVERIHELFFDGGLSVKDTAKGAGVSEKTVRRYIDDRIIWGATRFQRSVFLQGWGR